jgi:hypothetical protein
VDTQALLSFYEKEMVDEAAYEKRAQPDNFLCHA